MLWQILLLIVVGEIVPAVILVGTVVVVTKTEYRESLCSPLIIGGLVWGVVVLISTPLVYDHFQHQILQFGEDLNAVVVNVKMVPTICQEDGACRWTYDCYPYPDTEYYYTTNGKGKRVRQSRTVIKYHACPYSSEEDAWLTVTSLKENPQNSRSNNVTITEAEHRFPQDTSGHLWRDGQPIPFDIMRSAGIGVPEISNRYAAILHGGMFPAISVKNTYDNYLLSDPDTTIRPSVSEDELRPLLAKHLLPKLNINPDDGHFIDKVYFIGMRSPTNASQWQNVLSHFNAEAGQLRQMDLHLVILPDTAVGDLHQYALALRGYWADTTAFGKDALPKNAVVVIITTDGQMVKRTEVFTLMPPSADGVSNSLLFQNVQEQLPGVPFQAETLIGNPQPVVHQINEDRYDVRYQADLAGPGMLERLMITGTDHFQRVPMSSFRYLQDEILPTSGDCIWIAVIVFLIGLALGSFCTIGTYKLSNP